MTAKDGNVIVRDYAKNITMGKKQFLQTINEYIDTDIEPVEVIESVDINISHDDYTNCISSSILTDEFIKHLQITQFKTEYEAHPNIGYFSFERLTALYPTIRKINNQNIIYSERNETYNISYRHPNGWYSVKGTKAGNGAFIESATKTSTLLLVEGLKDAINANIAFPTVDILAVNGKGNKYNFSLYNIDLKNYKNIIFCNDRDALDNLLKMFPVEHKEHFKKTKFIDWNKIEKGKDITDFIWHSSIPKMTKRDRIRNSLPLLKKVLHKSNFNIKYEELRINQGRKTMLEAIETDSKDIVMRAIKTVNNFNGNIIEGAKYYLQKQNETKGFEHIIKLENNRLSIHTDKIIEVIDKDDRVFLNAPTGTGKSYTSLQELPKKYKNIIIISPLRMVTNEHGGKDTLYTNVTFSDKIEAIQADLFSPYIAITTDMFTKLSGRFNDIFNDRLAKADLIIFDEQHLYYDSLGFRDNTVVKCYEYLLYKHSGKVLFMSGTPILPKDKKVALITAKVTKKEIIKFYYNPFRDMEEIKDSIRKNLKKGSILIYVNSRAKVKELQKLLEGINTLGITSFEYIHNGKIVDDTILNNDLGNIVYISTTKATTGVNFRHLKTIYQYGTPYTPNTFIQLMARLRTGGEYYVIDPTYKQQKESYNAKRAIGLALKFKELKIDRVSDSFYGDEFQNWLKSFVLLSHNSKNLQGFYKTYKKAFQLLEAKGLGKFNEDNSDFTFAGHYQNNITNLFETDDKNEFRKYIEQIIIDYIIENDVEILNEIYNLSFQIVDATLTKSNESFHLITSEDKEAKKDEREKKKEEKKQLYIEIDEKFKELNITAKYLRKNKFSDTELSKLNDIKIHIDKIKEIEHQQDKVTALKFHLIPKQEIFKEANKLILENGYITVKELDSSLQTIFLTNARTKYPYQNLLIEAFKNDFFNNSYLKFTKAKRVGKKNVYNVIEITDEHKKEFENIRLKRERKKYLEDERKKEIDNYLDITKSKELYPNLDIEIETAPPTNDMLCVDGVEIINDMLCVNGVELF